MQKKQRIDWIDVAKGIAMICVILVHVEEHFLSPGALASTKIPIYTFHMPIFFFISGYLFSLKSSFKEFLINKCRRILIPYVCLGGLLCLFTVFWQKYDLKWTLEAILLQKRMWTLWFIACLFWLNILFYILARFIKSEKIRAIAVILIATAGIIYYKMGGEALYWNVDVCMTALPFFYAGFLCKKTDFVNQKVLASKFKWGIFVGLVALDFLCTMLNYRITGQYLEFFGCMYGIAPLTYIGSFAGIFALIILADACRGFKPFRYIGENSMMFYAWHQTMLLPLVQFMFDELNLFNSWLLGTGEYYGRLLLATFVICVVSALLNEIICKAKLGFIVGK